MTAIENRLSRLEARLAALEDMNAILRLIAAYGPAVDTLDAGAVAALWAAEGSYDWGAGALQGADTVGALVENPVHQAYVAAGSAHVLGLPLVQLQGDEASAVNCSRVYLHGADGWRVERCSANYWRFRRGPDGWRVLSRENRLLDGAEAARALLARGLHQEERA